MALMLVLETREDGDGGDGAAQCLIGIEGTRIEADEPIKTNRENLNLVEIFLARKLSIPCVNFARYARSHYLSEVVANVTSKERWPR